MNFTPRVLWAITARTLIVHGDRDPLSPVPRALEISAAIPHSSLGGVLKGGDRPIFGELRVSFVDTVSSFPAEGSTAGSAR